jgi:fibronectin type 3 domain-containing protein
VKLFKLVAVVLGVMLTMACPPVSPAASHSATVTWQAGGVYTSTTVYRLYKSTNGTSFAMLASMPTTQTTYVDTAVTAGAKYWYYANARDSKTGLESARTPTVTCVIP